MDGLSRLAAEGLLAAVAGFIIRSLAGVAADNLGASRGHRRSWATPLACRGRLGLATARQAGDAAQIICRALEEPKDRCALANN